jgi:hypothetical protein
VNNSDFSTCRRLFLRKSGRGEMSTNLNPVVAVAGFREVLDP